MSVTCAIRKDSGDDPDDTNGILIYATVEKTAEKGINLLGGIGIGYWKDIDELKEQWCLDKVFNPQMKEDTARKLLNEWHKAVGRSQNWAE